MFGKIAGKKVDCTLMIVIEQRQFPVTLMTQIRGLCSMDTATIFFIS